MNCAEAQQETSVALLTHTQVSEDIARHTATCPACAAAQARVLPLSALLATVRPDDLDVLDSPAAPPDELLLQRTLAAVRRERTQRRRWLILAGAAAAVLVAIVAVPSFLSMSGSHPQLIRATASGGGIHASATVAAAGSGSSLAIAINGVPADTWCVLTVEGTDGSRHVLTRWKADYEGTATVHGTSPAAPGDIDRIVISSDAGIPLLEIPVAT